MDKLFTKKALALGLAAVSLLTGCGQTGLDDPEEQDVRDVFSITRKDEASEPEATVPETTASSHEESAAGDSSETGSEESSLTEEKVTVTTAGTTETTTTAATTTATVTSAPETQPVQQTEQEYYYEENQDDNGGWEDQGGQEEYRETGYVQPEEPPQETTATTAATTTTTTTAAQPEQSGGHVIEEIDGVTYVDGILIVNKTYSLPSSYAPPDYGLTEETYNAYLEMKAAAARDGFDLPIASGYRSYWTQQDLYNNYYWYYGWYSEADRFSARPGHSEHQTGLAIDLVQASRYTVGWPVMDWIEEHCVEYGFIVRYPEGKEDITGFMYEPWHVRYLGKENARKVADSGLTLEEYLGVDSVYRD